MKFGVDIHLILATVGLVLIGLLIHLSLSPDSINSHVVFVILGVLSAILLSKVDFKLIRLFSRYLYLFVIFILVLTLVVGTVSRGSQRWLDLGLFRFQTSELAKLILIVLVADWIDKFGLNKVASLLKIGLLVAVPILLIFVQPDLGSSIIIGGIILVMLFVGGISYKYVLSGALIVAVISPLLWLGMQDYQKDRVYTFLNPAADPLGTGYNVIQSQIAVGSGQFFGRGLGHGTQSKLRFLPEYQTDFVFASLAEELGLVGSLILIFGFSYLILRLIYLAVISRDLFTSLVLTGITTMIVSQMLINIGMNIGLLPVTGITLPFISAGGTSLVISLASVGIAIGLVSRLKISPGIEIKAETK